jgi:tRNA(adenine34) deaminase
MKAKKIHEVRMMSLINSIESRTNSSEIPIACAIYGPNEELFTLDFNSIEEESNPTGHAEITAIKNASRINFHQNLEHYSIYVTLEPCLMCLGAIHHSNISKVIFGAYSDQIPEHLSFLNLFRQVYPKIEIIGGVLEKECKQQISNWFKSIR